MTAPREHLATREEVLDHFMHCVDVVRRKVQVEERYGWECVGEEETADGVVVTARSADGGVLTVRTDRLIKAFGARIEPNQPLQVSSDNVRSVSPDFCDMRPGEIAEDRAPV